MKDSNWTKLQLEIFMEKVSNGEKAEVVGLPHWDEESVKTMNELFFIPVLGSPLDKLNRREQWETGGIKGKDGHLYYITQNMTGDCWDGTAIKLRA